MDIFQKSITPDKPRVLAEEQIYVYVPQATSSNAGIAGYTSRDFNVNDSIVSLKWPIESKIQGPLNTASLVKVDSSEFENTNENIITEYEGNAIMSQTGIKLVRTERDAYSRPDFVMLDSDYFPRELIDKDGQKFYKYTTSAVHYIVQNLTEAQKVQARENINAGSLHAVEIANSKADNAVATAISAKDLALDALDTASTADETANEALRYVKEEVGTQITVGEDFVRTLVFTSDPQEQLDNKADTSLLEDYVTKGTEQTIEGTKKFTANNNTFTRTLILGANTPINFTGIGAGTYNIGAFVCNNIDKFGVECPRETDSGSAAIIPFRIGARGGQLGILQSGNIYQNGKQVANQEDVLVKADTTYVDAQIAATNKIITDNVNSLSTTKADITYVDQKIADLVGSAPDALNTLEELSAALNNNKDIVKTINDAIATKANSTDVNASFEEVSTSLEEVNASLEEVNTLIATKADASDLAKYVPLTGSSTISGNLTVGIVQAQMFSTSGDVKAGYLQAKSAGHETGTYDKIATLSSTGYVRYRTKAEMKSDLGVPTDYVTTGTAQKIEGAKYFTGTVGNIQTESGIYLGLDQNTGAENANMAIVSSNTAAYIDMGRPDVDYDFRIIKWNTADNKHAQLVYAGNASGTITIPQASGTMALTHQIPAEYVKSATVSNGAIVLTKQDGTTVSFAGSGITLNQWNVYESSNKLIFSLK